MDLTFYWKLLLRRLPVMTGLFLLCAGLGVALAVKLPTTYESTARLLVEAPQIPSNLASSTVQTSPAEEIEIVRQQILTRANLIDIANKFEVFANLRTMAPDDVVSQMRDATRISRSDAGRGGPTIVIVTVRARTGEIAAAVVNEYVTRIVEANVRQRTGRAGDTLAFFEQEVERLSRELEIRSARITAFQRENANSLPQSLSYKMGRQTLLLERNSAAARERSNLADQKERILALFEATGQVPGAQANASPEARELQRLEAELASALTIYSETNPRIVALKNRIAQAQQALAVQTGASGGADAARALVDLQVADLDQRIAGLDTEIARTEAELATLEAEIRDAPENGVILESMQRDYDSIRQQYDNAVSSLAQARLGERIELTARGQRISLIENGNVPNAPASPNRPLVAMAGVAAGLGLAGAFFAALELLNRTVRRPAEVAGRLGIAPLATIPFIETALHRRLRRTARVLALVAVMVGVPAALWAVDTYYLPLELLVQRLFSRIGIA